jgi:hypothetical protein
MTPRTHRPHPLAIFNVNDLPEIFPGDPNIVRDIRRHRRDAIKALLGASPAAKFRMAFMYGDDFLPALREVDVEVRPENAEDYFALVADGHFGGEHNAVVEAVSRKGLSHLVDGDHLVQQHTLRMFMAGTDGFRTRTSQLLAREVTRAEENLLNEAYAIAVPKNEIIFYRMVRHLRNKRIVPPWFMIEGYYHTAKTAEMRRYLVPDFEGEYSIPEIWDAYRWVLLETFKLPKREFLDPVRNDMIEAIVFGIENNPEFREQALRFLRGKRLSTADLPGSLRIALFQDTPLTAARFRPRSRDNPGGWLYIHDQSEPVSQRMTVSQLARTSR